MTDIEEGRPLPETPELAHREARAAGALGVLMVLAGIVVLIDAARLRDSDETLGPAAAPTLLGILLAVIGGALAFQSRHFLRTAQGPKRNLWRLAALVVVLIAFALLLPIMGYVVSSAGLFVGAALLLGAPHPARVLAYGWTLAIVVFLVFDVLIGLSLPTGPWGF
ncbi:tripartite tricarboxylate transporter TctB family protein [Actinoplanes sp. Pm04-4]|uniref:Tripartite tricarboxylate transporter TctB family protein n=1 Tax=Paractinoplanes pyxinae TaxID=2997416 RepID=A0ABT4BG64_9ACTN|nr:tripartite tricarboxylate transporter TctB family protein [Actinoplanes pyxinae]MCY1145535.1 tripartite tricarboxylate transporter TctB family protein [Actinoplanes pyxinae]